MIRKDVMTKTWGNKEIVTSPFYGVIKKIMTRAKNRIYEWEPLFTIQTDEGTLVQISVGIGGIIDKLFVKEGDRVIPGAVLAYIDEDLIVTGSD